MTPTIARPGSSPPSSGPSVRGSGKSPPTRDHSDDDGHPPPGSTAGTPSSSSRSSDGQTGQAGGTKPPEPSSLSLSTTSTSAGAAVTRSILLFMGIMFRRPSKLFRPNRVDTWGAVRHLAVSADQNLSPSFIRSILKSKGGVLALGIAIVPPLLINTTLGFLLFTTHSLLSLGLARLSFFQRKIRPNTSDPFNPDHEHSHDPLDMRDPLGVLDGDYGEDTTNGQGPVEDPINFETLIRGPSVIPRHPTLLSALAGAGAGVVQGLAFTPIENVVKLLQQSTTSLTVIVAKFINLPLPKFPTVEPQAASPAEALRNFFASDTWRKSRSWWTGWRWAVARDALSYSVFFAAFDITRRIGLRVKALFGGPIQTDWHNFLIIKRSQDLSRSTPSSPFPTSLPSSPLSAPPPPSETPTVARVAQAATIVAGGVTASIMAEIAGRPFRACQRIMTRAATDKEHAASLGGRHPLLFALRKGGLRPFLHPDGPVKVANGSMTAGKMLSRIGWRLAAVGPWGFGFLVWAWVGGEV